MATGDFDLYYSDTPWEAIDKNQRVWYDPDLVSMFRNRAVFASAIPFVKNLGAVNATSMVVSQFMDPHPDFTALTTRQIWMPASHVDSRSQSITFSRYGGKVAYHEYDDIINYWKVDQRAGLRRILQGSLGVHNIEVMDMLARNAFITGAYNSGYKMFAGGGSDFSDLSTADKFSPDIALDIWLGMANRGVASALGANGAQNSIICYTTPGVIYDIQKNASADDWLSASEYLSINRYEVGMYKNVRFVQAPQAMLYNCGTVTVQPTVTSAITAGDGAPDPASVNVDNVYAVGQSSGGITNYIQLSAVTSLAVGDVVSIHTTRTSAFGITNGVDYREGTLQNRRIISIDAGNVRITLDRPIMTDMNTDLGGGVYAYVTKGRHIHASIFVGGPQGIVAGVARPPRFHAPPPVDDFQQVHRFSWDAYMGFNTYRPESFEVVFSAGSFRVKGATVVQ